MSQLPASPANQTLPIRRAYSIMTVPRPGWMRLNASRLSGVGVGAAATTGSEADGEAAGLTAGDAATTGEGEVTGETAGLAATLVGAGLGAAVVGAAAGGAVVGAAGAAVGVGAAGEHPATPTAAAASARRPHLIRLRFNCVTSCWAVGRTINPPPTGKRGGALRPWLPNTDRHGRSLSGRWRWTYPPLTRGRGVGVG